jgi:hypothetical protein
MIVLYLNFYPIIIIISFLISNINVFCLLRRFLSNNFGLYVQFKWTKPLLRELFF